VAVVLGFVALAHATDPIICSDGCTDESRESHSASTPGHDAASTCLLCQNGITAGPETVTPSIVRADTLILLPGEARVPSVPDRRIDHPPRLS
jgi:hypothetical protein